MNNIPRLKLSFLAAIMAIFLASSTDAKPRRNLNAGLGSCAEIVVIESIEVFNYLANVTFKVPVAQEGVWQLSMMTDEPFTFFGGWGVKIEVDEKTHTAVKMTSNQPQTLKRGDKISFRFRMYWSRDEKTWPKVTNIIWENHLICDSSKAEESYFKAKNQVSNNSILKYKYLTNDPETSEEITNMI